MTQAVRTRLDRLETLSGATGRVQVVMEDSRGILTTLDGEPWSIDQAGALDTIVRLVSFAGGAA